jgi:hypothetical protein
MSYNEPISCKRKKNETRIKIMFSYEVTMWFGKHRLCFGEHTSLKMQAEGSPKILVTVYQTIWCPIQKTVLIILTDIKTSKSHIQNKVFCLTLLNFPIKFYLSKIYYIFKTCLSKEIICAQSHPKSEC